MMYYVHKDFFLANSTEPDESPSAFHLDKVPVYGHPDFNGLKRENGNSESYP